MDADEIVAQCTPNQTEVLAVACFQAMTDEQRLAVLNLVLTTEEREEIASWTTLSSS